MIDITNLTEQDKAGMEAQRFASPIPGSSMTNDPDAPPPGSRAPEFTNVDKALEHIVDTITGDEKLDQLTDSLVQGAPADGLAKVILEQGFAKGRWNPDLVVLMAEPLTYIILSIGELVGANPELSGDDEDAEGDENILESLGQAPDSLDPQLLASVKTNVQASQENANGSQ